MGADPTRPLKADIQIFRSNRGMFVYLSIYFRLMKFDADPVKIRQGGHSEPNLTGITGRKLVGARLQIFLVPL